MGFFADLIMIYFLVGTIIVVLGSLSIATFFVIQMLVELCGGL
jgi:hypothetical protein